MANQTATLKHSLTYPAPGGGTVTVPVMTSACAFQASSVGFIDVPDATADGVSFAVPFGTIGTGASLVVLQNQTGQDLELKINGSLVVCALADDAVLSIAQPDLPGSVPITSVSVLATALQVGDGLVGYFVFGDPT